MSTQITTAMVKKFASGIRILQQQMDSRLRDCVSVDSSVVGDRAFYDQVDAVDAVEVTNRHGDTEYVDTPHKRRQVTLKTFEVADLVDRADVRRVLNNPTAAYGRQFAAAMNRKIDDRIIAAFMATAATGPDGQGSAPFDTDYSFASATATQMTYQDLLTARRILEAGENMEDSADYSWGAVMNAARREDLLSDETLTSADYNTVKALVSGQLTTFVGFDFKASERLPIDSGGLRDSYFWVKSSMKLAISQEPRGFLDILPQKRHSLQSRYELDCGATRMDEKGVVRVTTDEIP